MTNYSFGVHEVASGSEEETDEEETDDDLEIIEPVVETKKRRGVAQTDTSSRKKAKLEPSPEKKQPRKCPAKAKVPFAMARKMIPLMIFDEDELRNLALDFSPEVREEINEACDLINLQGWFELAKGTSRANADEVRQFYANLSGVAPKTEAAHSTDRKSVV